MAGSAIRDAKVGDARALSVLFIEGWQDENAGLLPEAVLAARSRAESEANWLRPLWRIEAGGDAEMILVVGQGPLDGLIVGLREARAWPGAAEVSVIQVARAARRRGVGAALMREVAARLERQGAETIIVRVLEANDRARRFYEALGGELMAEVGQVEESGFLFPERTYVWREIGRLAR